MREPILEVSDLVFWYEDEATPVLRGVDLAVERGEFLVLVGANGSGKTTLTKHFNGLLRPRRGHVRVNGEETSGRPVGELARHVGYLFQNPEQQIFSPSVREEVAFGPQNLGLPAGVVETQVEEALDRFRLGEVAEMPPAVLGYGLRRRVTLASLAAMDPPVLVLDEPTVGLDARGLAETLDWLAELQARGRTIVLVTHEMALAAEHADRVVAMSEGQIMASAPPAELFQQRELLSRASLAAPPV
ncbi:MAG: ATP-binding cassette domain-containing protein, partial [Anaerolineae bacterium]|nr:ATP-binding cassette domain-containing protein [Anaerolineae bacterium]